MNAIRFISLCFSVCVCVSLCMKAFDRKCYTTKAIFHYKWFLGWFIQLFSICIIKFTVHFWNANARTKNMLRKVYKSIWDVLQCATENMFAFFCLCCCCWWCSSTWFTNEWLCHWYSNQIQIENVRLACQCCLRDGICKFEYIKWTLAKIYRARDVCIFVVDNFFLSLFILHASRLTLRNWVLLGLLLFLVHRFPSFLLCAIWTCDWFDARGCYCYFICRRKCKQYSTF